MRVGLGDGRRAGVELSYRRRIIREGAESRWDRMEGRGQAEGEGGSDLVGGVAEEGASRNDVTVVGGILGGDLGV